MRKNTHKKIFAFGCIISIISLAGIKAVPVSTAGTNEQKSLPGSGKTNEESTLEKGLFAPGIKTKNSNVVFWYKCIVTKDGKEKIYYRSKKQIPEDANNLIRELKNDKNFFSTEVTNQKEIEKIEELFELSTEPSALGTANISATESIAESPDDPEIEALKENKISKGIKTPEEFEKLLKSEKAEYLANPRSSLMAKMRCYSCGSNIFEYNNSHFHALLTLRVGSYFEELFVENKTDLKKPENKKLYSEYLECICNLHIAIEKFMDDSELCEIYQQIYNILNNKT